MIDDDDICSNYPVWVPPGCAMNVECFGHMITQARVTSYISKRLATGKAFRQTPEQIKEAIRELDLRLHQWRESLPSYLQPDAPLRFDQLPPNIHIYYKMYLRYSYFGNVMAIHSIFTYPWNTAVFGTDQSPALRTQISMSTHLVVEAARKIIIDTNYIQIDASTPTW